MTRTLVMLCTLSLALAAGACEQSGATMEQADSAGSGWYFWAGNFAPGTPIEVGQGELGGDFGHRPSHTAMAAQVDGYEDGAWTEVKILVDGPDGASMAIFEVWGGLRALRSGSTQVYDRWDSRDDGAYVSVIGCVGDAPYAWDRDDAAEQVRVTVTDHPTHPDTRIYEFTASFARPQYGASNASTTTELSGRFQAR
jgi:hypothetical protein